MHVLVALLAAAAVQAAPSDAQTSKEHVVTCHWESGTSTGIPVKVCMTGGERKLRATYEQQQIRESQARSYLHN